MKHGALIRWIQGVGRYALSLATVSLAVLLTAALSPLQTTPAALFVLAVMVSAWYGGPGAATFASILSLLAVDYFFIPPIFDIRFDGAHLERAIAFGLILGFVIWFTESRRKLERELRLQAARLSEQTRLLETTQAELRTLGRRKDEFLAVLSHELRNPLGALRNGIHVLRSGAPVDGEAIHAMLDRQLHRLVRLVDDLIDVARIESGKIRLRKEVVELASVVRDAVDASRAPIETQGHALTVALPREPIHLKADRLRLAQVLSNLLDNAAKFTAPGGQIWLTAAREDGHVSIAVRDTGIGIPAELLASVFEMFTQGSQPDGRKQEGLGIGLSIVRRLVELHEGTIELASEGLNRGAEFTVRLPLLPATREVPEPPAVPFPSPRRKPEEDRAPSRRVLIVDDDPDSADALAQVVTWMGHETRTARDGAAAIAAAAAFRPEVVLLDLGLPGMSGYEIGERLKEQTCPEATLVAVTGWGQDADRRKSLEKGFRRHLVKPVDPAELKELLGSEELVQG